MLGGSGEGASQFHKQYADYYRELVALLVHKRDVNRAFETLKRSRAQTLGRMLAGGDLQLHTGAPKALVEEERRLNTQISDLAADLWRLRSVSQVGTSQQKLVQRMADLLNEREQVRSDAIAECSVLRPYTTRSLYGYWKSKDSWIKHIVAGVLCRPKWQLSVRSHAKLNRIF